MVALLDSGYSEPANGLESELTITSNGRQTARSPIEHKDIFPIRRKFAMALGLPAVSSKLVIMECLNSRLAFEQPWRVNEIAKRYGYFIEFSVNGRTYISDIYPHRYLTAREKLTEALELPSNFTKVEIINFLNQKLNSHEFIEIQKVVLGFGYCISFSFPSGQIDDLYLTDDELERVDEEG